MLMHELLDDLHTRMVKHKVAKDVAIVELTANEVDRVLSYIAELQNNIGSQLALIEQKNQIISNLNKTLDIMEGRW